MALLALYPDEQEKLYQHILSVCPHDQRPRYDDLPQLTRSMAYALVFLFDVSQRLTTAA